MVIRSRLALLLALIFCMPAAPAMADWFTKLLGVGAVVGLGSFAKSQTLLHLQSRSTAAITRVQHDRPCDARRSDFEAILPLAAEAALLASDAYADPQAAGPGVSRMELTVPDDGRLGAYATTLWTTLQGYPVPGGFPHPAGWGQSADRYYDAVFVTFRGTNSLVDWLANFHQGIGATPQQYQWALRHAQSVIERAGADTLVIFSGHSLGGSLATYSALRFGKGAITFNAAGLHPANLVGAVGDISRLRTSDIGSVYHFLSHSEDGVTDLVGNLSFAGYMLLPGGKYFINLPGFRFGSAPSLLRYVDLHAIDPLWQELAAHRRHARPALSCVELHGRAIYIHP